MCLGLRRRGSPPPTDDAAAGDPVLYLGQSTAPEPPADGDGVSVIDTLAVRLLADACLELHARGVVRSMVSVGPVGLARALHQVASETRAGVDADLAEVPVLDRKLGTERILASRTPGRMLVVVSRAAESDARALLEERGVQAARIGAILAEPRLVVRSASTILVDLPRDLAIPESGERGRIVDPPPFSAQAETAAPSLEGLADSNNPILDLERLLASHAIASRDWIHGQFDQSAGNGTLLGPNATAAVLRLRPEAPASAAPGTEGSVPPPPTERFLGVTLHRFSANGATGSREAWKRAVMRSVGSLACRGAIPVAIVHGVRIAPEPTTSDSVSSNLHEAGDGIVDACRILRIPVREHAGDPDARDLRDGVGGSPVVVGALGIIEKAEHVVTPWFKKDGDAILLLGNAVDTNDPLRGLGGSLYLGEVHGRAAAGTPDSDLEAARTLHGALAGLIQAGGIRSAHDCGAGGLGVALAEACLLHPETRHGHRMLGASVDLGELQASCPRLDALFFGESPSRVLVSCDALDAEKILARARVLGVAATRLGTVGGDRLTFKVSGSESSVVLKELRELWWNAIGRIVR
ncbi:MAG: hypothetical protein JNL97_06670 [Verrucomicrobiales bacterium]|nr:hypothetical protein [Verrucomicrobiales bacterium]